MTSEKEPYWRSPLTIEADQIASAAAIEALELCFDEMEVWAEFSQAGAHDLSITVVSIDRPVNAKGFADSWHKEFSLLEAIRTHIQRRGDPDSREDAAKILERMATAIRNG